MPRTKGTKVKPGADLKPTATLLKKTARKDDGNVLSGHSPTDIAKLEQDKERIERELSEVEAQIFRLETQYFKQVNEMGNALIGYAGLLADPTAKRVRDPDEPIAIEERRFSASSVTGIAAGIAAGLE